MADWINVSPVSAHQGPWPVKNTFVEFEAGPFLPGGEERGAAPESKSDSELVRRPGGPPRPGRAESPARHQHAAAPARVRRDDGHSPAAEGSGGWASEELGPGLRDGGGGDGGNLSPSASRANPSEAEQPGGAVPAAQKRARPGRRERQELKSSRGGSIPQGLATLHQSALARLAGVRSGFWDFCVRASSCGGSIPQGLAALVQSAVTRLAGVRSGFWDICVRASGFFKKPIVLGLVAVTMVFACAFLGAMGFLHYKMRAVVEAQAAARIMTQHSEHQLNQSSSGNDSDASLSLLQDKLQFSKMNMELDTQVFTAKREKAQDVIKSICDLPEKICNSMAVAAAVGDGQYHKKRSVPLDENRGSYVAVWMWVKPAVADDEVQVAFKAASLSYQLRDVVTYREQVDEEPVVKCTESVESNWFGSTRSSSCSQVATKKTVTPIPVFKQAVMNPREMELVDSMMERMLARRVLENIAGSSQAIGQRAAAGALPEPAPRTGEGEL